MALSIKTQEADVLARRLVRLTGETITEAITIALRERLSREEARRAEANDQRSASPVDGICRARARRIRHASCNQGGMGCGIRRRGPIANRRAGFLS
jgi:antitoxin VapB